MKNQTNTCSLFFLSTLSCLLLLIATSCNTSSDNNQNQANDHTQIVETLDQFNEAAANADFKRYFDFYTEDAIFIGTDATENWNKKQFMEWSKPRFDKKKTWHFKSIDRHIYFDKTGSLAWFDELLDTRMKICRGSGVLIKQDKNWKVQQYVLSMTIPNSLSDTVIKIKASAEDELIKKITEK